MFKVKCKKGRLDLLTSTEQALYNKVMFTPEHSVPRGNLLLEISCSKYFIVPAMPRSKIYYQPAENISTAPPPQNSQVKLAGFCRHNSQCWIHNTFGSLLWDHLPIPPWTLQTSQTLQTSGSEHLKAEIKAFPRVSGCIRHCQQALTRLQEWGRDFGEQCLLWHICPEGTKRIEPTI